MRKPLSGEYPTYYEAYISLVPEGSIEEILNQQLEDTIALLSNISELQANHRYAAGKWTLKEVIGHMSDTERVMSYRLLRIARGDQTPLAGYDDQQYVTNALFHARSVADLLEHLIAVRRATAALLRGLPEETWANKGIANNSELSVRALAYIIAGHELHHRAIIKEKYLI